QRRVDEQVADQRGGDGHAEHGVEVLGRVAAGDLLGQDDHDRGHDAAEHVDPHRRAEPGVDHAQHPGARPEPMIQVAAEVTRHRMNSRTLKSPRTRPAPDSVAVPSAATCPPYTVKTDWMALMNPLKLVLAVVGRTIRMPITGSA